MKDRATAGGGTSSPVTSLSVFGRMGSAMANVIDWFGPRQALPPVAQDAAVGRLFDYPVGHNQNLLPRAYEAISFEQLRQLADSYDLMRLIIETRKDQLARVRWVVRYREKGKREDARVQRIIDFLQRPDREHDWDVWLRALLEDMLVIDAATIYPRKTRGGGLYSLELIDGATIKRIINSSGRTPLPDEGPAYQQVLKGMGAADYKANELFYRVRNWRTHKIYGYSPVEQVMVSVNIALRRQVHQLHYYTEGNVPEALIGVPETWTAQQIKEWQTLWDELIEGNSGKRRHARFVPGGMNYQPTKEAALKDMFDEWLARIVCFAFSISPNAFIAQVNRATAEVSQEAALEEGLAPVKAWVANTMNAALADAFGAPDLEFAWVDEESIDPVAKATIHGIYVDKGVITNDEAREDLGRDPLTAEQVQRMRELAQARGAPVMGQPDDEDQDDDLDEGEPAAKGEYLGSLAKAGRAKRPFVDSPAPINRGRRAAKRAYTQLKAATEAALSACADEAVALFAGGVAKADAGGVVDVIEQLKLEALEAWRQSAEDTFTALAKDAGRLALRQVGVADADILSVVNDRAVSWARNHAAGLVGKKWVGGRLVDNPNPAVRIDEVTRQGVRKLVEKAQADGWSNDKLAKALRTSYPFSKERAKLIAVTETAFTDVAGNMIGWEESGVVQGKRWLLANRGDPRCCDSCTENANAGAIALSAPFPSGHGQAPAHPRCRCDVSPVPKLPQRRAKVRA